MSASTKAKAVTVGAGLVTIIAAVAFKVTGLCINTTPSIPIGLYAAEDSPVTVGAYVIFCPPQSPVFENALRRGYIEPGHCPGTYGRLMKKVLAAKDDVVAISERGVEVNGTPVPHSTPQSRDAHGRPLTAMYMRPTTLTATQLLLMTDRSEQSFDARYFGLVERAQVLSVIRPLITW